MNYVLIGTGNMAWLVAARMSAAGHTCTGIWGRNAAACAEISQAYSLRVLPALHSITDGPDACIVTVSDGAISEVTSQLKLKQTTLLHTAGAVSMSVLAGASENTGVLWPVYSIRRHALPHHRAFPVLIEGNTERASSKAREVASAICDTVVETTSEQRAWLHLAAVISNNFVNHLLSITADICMQNELPFSLMQPIIEQTVRELKTSPPQQNQTGPAKRGDSGTMSHHLALLEAFPDAAAIYETISMAIMNLYKPIAR